MTESEWLDPEDRPPARPLALLDRVVRATPPRKLQLIAAAVCRLLDDLKTRPELLQGVLALERYAEGFASETEFTDARQMVYLQQAVDWGTPPNGNLSANAVAAAMHTQTVAGVRVALDAVVKRASSVAGPGHKRTVQKATRRAISGIIREVIANPFRPFRLLASWQGGGIVQPDDWTVMFTDSVKGIADAIHLTGDFSRLPILADALEEAGVTDEALLAHCRDGGPHVRGCWALDVVRGRA
jgi:hypothetical protein